MFVVSSVCLSLVCDSIMSSNICLGFVIVPICCVSERVWKLRRYTSSSRDKTATAANTFRIKNDQEDTTSI